MLPPCKSDSIIRVSVERRFVFLVVCRPMTNMLNMLAGVDKFSAGWKKFSGKHTPLGNRFKIQIAACRVACAIVIDAHEYVQRRKPD